MSVVNDGKGIGGFLCPPTHPAHSHFIAGSPRRGGDYDYYMSIESVLNPDRDISYVPQVDRDAATALLEAWARDKPALDHPDVQDWILQVLGYFRGCFANRTLKEPTCWDAGSLSIVPLPPGEYVAKVLAAPEDHAGVHLIRQYYPEFTPTEAQLRNAYWGTKPTA